MGMKKSELMRVSPEFAKLVNYIRAKNMLVFGRKPKITSITRNIARQINKNNLFHVRQGFLSLLRRMSTLMVTQTVKVTRANVVTIGGDIFLEFRSSENSVTWLK